MAEAPDKSSLNSDEPKPTGRPQREKHPTMKALNNDIEAGKGDLHQQWKKIKQLLSNIKNDPDEELLLLSNLNEVRSALRIYKELWSALEQLYAQDQHKTFTDDALHTKTAFLDNCYLANDAISQTIERIHTLTLETRSNVSQRSRRSTTSRASSVLSSRAKALADAAAAAEDAKFEEAIAKQAAKLKADKATDDIERAKAEAEHIKRQATAEADLQILCARKSAAVEKARTAAILEAEAEQDDRVVVLKTSPDQTSNDHSLRFQNESVSATFTPTQQLRASAPIFQPPTTQQVYIPPHYGAISENPPRHRPVDEYAPFISLTKEITDTLTRQRQPAHEPDVYDGDPIMFRPWRQSFEMMVNQARTPATQKLTFLNKYTKGEVRKLVDRFRHRYVSKPETAYQEAWKELEERFGNKTRITTHIIDKLNNFSKVKTDESQKLLELADLCTDVAAQMDDLPDLKILNYSHNLHPILDKLPTHIHNTWRKRASEYKTSNGCYPPFPILAKFLKEKAKLHNDLELYPSSQPNTPASQKNRNPGSSFRVMATSTPIQSTPPPKASETCVYHDKQGHHVSECITFSRKPVSERKDFCKKKGLCFKCGLNHIARECTTKVLCKKCKGTNHATFMHITTGQNEENPNKGQPTYNSTDANTKCTRELTCSSARSCSKIVLCKIYCKNSPSHSILGYAVLDDQSNTCLADAEVFNSLNISGPSLPYEISTCGGDRITAEGRRASDLIVESLDGRSEQLPTVIENSHIPGDRSEIPDPNVCRSFPHLTSIAEKIPEPRDGVNIVLLIGRNCPEPLKVRESRNGPRGTPWAQRTDLGWTVSGQVCMSGVEGKVHTSVKRTILQSPLDDQYICENHIFVKDVLSKPQKIDEIYQETAEDDTQAKSVDDKRFIKIMTEGAHVNSEGNLEFPLPFKKETFTLPNNQTQARNRLGGLLKTLRRKPEMMKNYIAFFDKLLTKGHASPAPENLSAPPGTVWYLPHFAVRHPKKPDIRVVFDASAQFNGYSLNNALIQGPDQMNSLLGILFRFRLENTALMGDVEHMFYNFYVNPEHRDYLRFLWFEDNNPEKPIIDYRMNVHLFGSVSSPAVATFGLRMVADECRSSHGDDVTEFIKRDFYVDDGLTSQPNSEMALSLIQRSRDALATRKLRFHKIASSSKEVMDALPEEARAKELKNLDLDVLPTQRSLGVYWCLERDAFTFQVNLQDKPFSRRGVLSVASSIFDPIGFVAPVTIEGKIILRTLMTEMKKEPKIPGDLWDRPLPKEHLPRWARWRNSLHHLENILIQRCYKPPNFGTVKRREIHVFSDASNQAIGAVAYLRLFNESDQPHVSFLSAKAKMTPLHEVSIPRLELCGAVLATVLAQTVTSEIRDRITIDSTTFYTDSMVVLGYISNHSKRFHVYVANRVHKIHKLSDPDQWLHISTTQNPADLATRTVPASQLASTSWFKGPEFLWQNSSEVMVEPHSSLPSLDDNDPEVRRQASVHATNISNNDNSLSYLSCERFARFSTWTSLKRAIATLIFRVATLKSRRQENPDLSQMGTRELQRAETIIITAVQKKHFHTEIGDLKKLQNADSDPYNAIKKESPLYSLSPFIGEDGMIRVGGRLRRADLDLGGRHPVLLPKDSHVSKLIIQHVHIEVQHQGRHTTCAALRSGGKWVIGAHNLVRSVINQCTICRRLRGKLLNQVMADLPNDRLEATPPFVNVGMDVFGPWNVTVRKTRVRTETKRWAVIFTCLCIRAIHIEVIETMDTSSLILALRRFISLRGPIARLRCDRGTNFVGANGELAQEQVAKYLTTKNCEWVFNPPKASHFGGVWERQIQTVRRVLDSMFIQLGKNQFTHEVLCTFMAEVCAIVNSRPITTVSSDANDPQAITPAMLLTLKTQPVEAPPSEFVREDLYGRQRWRRVQYLADQFWLRWRTEYLQSLQPRQKWNKSRPNVSEGDVVLLRQKEVARNHWPLARIVKTFPSDDGKVRKVEVLTCRDGCRRTYLRPISELVLIEKALLPKT